MSFFGRVDCGEPLNFILSSGFQPILIACPSSRAPKGPSPGFERRGPANRGIKNLQNETSFLRLSSPVPQASSDEDHFPIGILHMTPHHVYSEPLFGSFFVFSSYRSPVSPLALPSRDVRLRRLRTPIVLFYDNPSSGHYRVWGI